LIHFYKRVSLGAIAANLTWGEPVLSNTSTEITSAVE